MLGYLKETIIFASRKTGKSSSLAHPDSYREVRVSGDVHNFFDLHYVYILYSDLLNRYYIGESENVVKRLKEHNDGYFKSSYTSTVNDWIVYLSIECSDRIQARKVEKHIKSMKSRKYIQNLKEYPELISKLKNKYK